MQDLVVCVGESCHLNGAEIVVKSFQKLIAEQKLCDRIALKGSFCIGECSEDGEVGVRWQDRVFTVNPARADEAFEKEVLFTLSAAMED